MINETEEAVQTRTFRVAQAKQLRAHKMALRLQLLRLNFKALYLTRPSSIILRIRKFIINLSLLKVKIMLLLTECLLQAYYLCKKIAFHCGPSGWWRRRKVKD